MGTNPIMNGIAADKPKTLLIFDFDHTITEGNTDVEVRTLAKDGQVPPRDRQTATGCWTDYMQTVFEFLHRQGVRENQYAECMRRMPFNAGMERLIRLAGGDPKIETVIVSDSNSFFIDTILKAHNLDRFVRRVFTNPAHFDETGCLRIRYFHTNTECELSEKNMCKGRIVKEYLQERDGDDVRFDRLAFVGDGNNDFCPIFRMLKERDHAFARKGFALEKKISQIEKKLPCQVHIWSSGDEIADFLGLATTN